MFYFDMPKPVKNEIFGTRKSILKPKLKKGFFSNVFLLTCLYRLNPNVQNRYILLRDCHSLEEFEQEEFQKLLKFLQKQVPLASVLFNKTQVQMKSHRSNFGRSFVDQNQFAEFLLNLTECSSGELTASTAKFPHTTEYSPLSRFLRKNVFGRLGCTDLDFVILTSPRRVAPLRPNRITIVEEKIFLDESGGSIGFGQYLSYRELISDVLNFNQQISGRFYLLFIAQGQPEICYCYDFMRELERPQRKPLFFDQKRGEQRVVFSKEEMTRLATSEFIEMIYCDK